MSALPFLPFEAQMLRHISPQLVSEKEDWEVLLSLAQLGFDGFITLDFNMLSLEREMSVIHQTTFTLVAIQAAGSNPLRAIGELLVQAQQIATRFDSATPQIFRIPKSRAVQPISAWSRLGELASGRNVSIAELFDSAKLSTSELTSPVI